MSFIQNIWSPLGWYLLRWQDRACLVLQCFSQISQKYPSYDWKCIASMCCFIAAKSLRVLPHKLQLYPRRTLLLCSRAMQSSLEEPKYKMEIRGNINTMGQLDGQVYGFETRENSDYFHSWNFYHNIDKGGLSPQWNDYWQSAALGFRGAA